MRDENRSLERPPIERRCAPDVSELLRQAGGFDGLGSAQEALGSSHLSASKREHPPGFRVQFHTALATTGTDASEGHDAVTCIAILRQLRVEFLKALRRVGEPSAEALVSSVDTAFRAPMIAE